MLPQVLFLGWRWLAAAASPEPVSLEECVVHAVQHSLWLKQQQVDRDRSALEVEAQRGVFWPRIFFNLAVSDERDPSTSAGQPEGQPDWVMEAGVEATTPFGTRVGATLSNNRYGASGISPAAPAEHQARLALSLTQPLLRGFGVEVNTAALEGSRQAQRQAAHAFRARLNQLIAQVEKAYCELGFAQRDLVIQSRALQLARQRFEDTRENIQRGVLPEHDQYVVEESLVSFERRHQQAEVAVRAAQSRLAELSFYEPEAAPTLVAVDRPQPEAPPFAEELLARALRYNPELQSAKAAVEEARLGWVVARDSRLPTLNLEAAGSLRGLGRGPGVAVDRLLSVEGGDVYLGARLELAPFDLVHDERERQAELDWRKALLSLQEQERALHFLVDNAQRDLELLVDTCSLSRRISELARKKLLAEQEKYQAGAAALKDLVQFLRELDEAETAEQRALLELQGRQTDLHMGLGDLHLRYGIEVE